MIIGIIIPFNAFARELPPEAASGFKAKPVLVAKQHMVVSGDVLASRAGDAVLAKGGNAVDAAIATQLVLNLVEPQASGIGGGGFLLYYNKKHHNMEAYDGRETAPRAATADMFLDESGKPLPYTEALKGGLSVGVPGLLRMLEQAHKGHGKLPWEALFAPAIALAEQGFPLSERVHTIIATTPYIIQSPEAKALYFTAAGTVKPIGTLITNPALANTLRIIAKQGADGFYRGEIASAMVQAVQHNPFRPGRLTLQDLNDYRAVKRQPICGRYRGHTLCGMPPPSSGGIAVLQALQLLEPFNLKAIPADSPKSTHLVMEAGRLAFADRNKYVADCAFSPVPVAAMLSSSYSQERSKLIKEDRALPQVPAGNLALDARCGTIQAAVDHPSTTHISIIDKEGNAVSLTSSIEYSFGSGVITRGFFLNNELTDFALLPEKDGVKAANRIEPGKRPRSSMSPMLVFAPNGQLQLVIGSPGGSRIISYVLQTLVNVIDHQMPLHKAINQPHYATTGETIELEQATPITAQEAALTALGHKVVIGDLTSGLHGIELKGQQLISGVDSRREGQAVGE